MLPGVNSFMLSFPISFHVPRPLNIYTVIHRVGILKAHHLGRYIYIRRGVNLKLVEWVRAIDIR